MQLVALVQLACPTIALLVSIAFPKWPWCVVHIVGTFMFSSIACRSRRGVVDGSQVAPHVNQLYFHAGMAGADPAGLISYTRCTSILFGQHEARRPSIQYPTVLAAIKLQDRDPCLQAHGRGCAGLPSVGAGSIATR